jgi:Cd2+/Zn2+-exporting ATPase
MIPPATDIIMFKRDLTMGDLMSEESEEYLILGDEESESPSDVEEQPSKTPSFPKLGSLRLPRRSRLTSGATSEPADEPLPEATREIPNIGLSLDGVHQFDWGIQGMDCPDCAMKATRAVNRLPGVESCRISVADGTVEISQNIARGSVSRASSVLGSLGHAPDIDWLHVVGADPERLASEQGISMKLLREWILDAPGVLDVRLNKGMVEVQRLWLRNTELREASEKKLAGILGPGFRMAPYRGARFRQDQIQLLSAALTIPLIIIVVAIEAADSIPSIVASLVALVGIAFTGLPMFQAALASLQNRIVGFQVLTTLAVVGAMALGEWVEALMVVALVAFASHLENRALIRARESMQGGLDRLPKVANGP